MERAVAVIPFPRHPPAGPARLASALARLEAALATQRAAVAQWRGALHRLEGAMATLGGSLTTHQAGLAALHTRIAGAQADARHLEAWADGVLGSAHERQTPA